MRLYEIRRNVNVDLLAPDVVGPKILSDLSRLSKNVKVICLCEMLNDLGASIPRPLLPVLYRILGATPLQYGIVEGLSSFFGMIGAAPAGSLSDKIGRKRIYCVGHAVMGVMRPTWVLVSSFWLLLPLRWLYTLGMAVRYAVRDPLLAESTTQETRGLTYAAYEISDCIGSFAGPFLSIIILAYVGQNMNDIRTLFFLAAIPNLISVLMIVFHIKETVNLDRPAKETKDFLARLRIIAEDKNLFHFTWITLLFTVFATAVDVEILYITFGPMKANALVTTIMFMFWTAATVLAALPAGRVVDRMGRKFGVILSFCFYIMSMIAIIVHHYVLTSIILVLIAFASLGLFDSFFSVSSRTFIADNTSIENRGTLMGLYTTLDGVCRRSFAPIIAGFLFTLYSSIAPFIVGLTVSMIATALLTRMTSEPYKSNRLSLRKT
jgi:MFS family permease